jgi:hypothetical protein
MNQDEFNDLAVVARDRVRKAVTLTTQLFEDDKEAAALLMAVSVDLFHGAVTYLSDDGEGGGMSEKDAFATVFGLMMTSLGKQRVVDALRHGKMRWSDK